MFARQWHGKVDEVVVVDDHITGVLSEHQAGKLLGIAETGIRMKGRRSTPGRYLRLPGVEKDAVPWPPKEGASRTARTSVTATRWRG